MQHLISKALPKIFIKLQKHLLYYVFQSMKIYFAYEQIKPTGKKYYAVNQVV